ncbi:MAG: hypothetical protein AAF502_15025 [Bacteroidota bacterium]
MISRFLLLMVAGLFLFTHVSEGQKILQVERSGRKKVQKYYIGDILNFKLKGEKTDYSLPIRDMDDRTGLLTFDNGIFHISEIGEIIVTKNQRAARAWNITFVNFGLSWALFTAIDVAVGGTFHWGAVVVVGSAILVGYLIKWLFSKRKLKLGKKRRLRILNLNISPSDFLNPVGGV